MKKDEAPQDIKPANGAAPPAAAANVPPALPPVKDSTPDLIRLMKKWRAHHRRKPQDHLLYHYTNAQGLYGMLSTGRVWATNVGFLNDPSEMRYAAQLIRSVVLEEAAKLQLALPAHEKKLSLSNLFPQLFASNSPEEWIDTLLKTFESQGDVYMTCFCAKHDLLSQWRGYGAKGDGYAMGFDAKRIGVPDGKADGVRLRRVIYEPRVQKQIVRDWVGTFFAILRQPLFAAREPRAQPQPEGGGGLLAIMRNIGMQVKELSQGWVEGNKRLKETQQQFTEFLPECLICFKDPAYAEEQEWRVIQFGQNVEVKFRPSGARIVPYVELELTPPVAGEAKRLPIKTITYGPTLDPDVAKKSLDMLLKSYKYPASDVAIKRSAVPFRAI
jgi:hypothetical protein